MSATVSPIRLAQAARALREGALVAYPTEGVWGLGCDPLNEQACMRLLALKARDWRKGLILVGADFAQLERFTYPVSNTAMKRASSSWPGPTTWVFPCSDDAPQWLTGEHDSIAVRVSAHPVVRALCERFGGAIVSTSANRASRAPARSAVELRLQFGNATPLIVPGALGKLERPTTIRNVVTGAILRR